MKIFEYVIHTEVTIIDKGTLLATSDYQARLLIGQKHPKVDFADENTRVAVRPFCN